MFNLVPWNRPKENQIEQFHKMMSGMFDRYLQKDIFWSPDSLFGDGWFPSVDVSESKKDITVKAEMPGMDPKDIDISLEDGILRIKGEKRKEEEERDMNFYRAERAYGYFNRTIGLPAEVDASKVDASYKNGILNIKLKKVKESEPKKIEIKTEYASNLNR
jgi:HSP20 family protein